MNKVYTSRQLEVLCSKLAENVKKQSGSLFSQTMIITQGGAMNDWLTGKLTEANGIFAHYAFQNQDGFLGQVYELLTGNMMRSNRDAIKFGVYKLLVDDRFIKAFPNLAGYYSQNDLRRIQLAEKIADLFDQYQLYREEMIKGWKEGKTSTKKPESENWQMWLWQQLGIPSKASIRDKVTDMLRSEPDKRSKLIATYPEIHLFGISVYTDFHLAFYKALGEYIPVHYYLCLPTTVEKFSHPLLESFGTKAKELLDQFKDLAATSEYFPEIIKTDTLLGRLQHAIAHNNDLSHIEKPAPKTHGSDQEPRPSVQTRFIASPKPVAENKPDNSIHITSHFTPVREVETLYNYLLNLFENDHEAKTLKPRDVLVVAPDINKYEPFIKAVFRNAPVRLPMRVTGAARNTGDSITASLELIVGLAEEGLTAEAVAGLLEQNRIGKAYRMEDTSYVRAMLNKAAIRFGRSNSLADDSHYVSWQYGLEKFVLGYAMLTDEAFDVSHRLTDEEKHELPDGLTNYPFPDAEASASHDLLRVKAFVDDLLALFEAQKELHTLASWKQIFLKMVMDKMVWSNDFDKKDREERNDIFRALGFTERLPEGVSETKVPWAVFMNELKKRLFTESREHEMNSGAITFTSAIPARGLPFKVIAFIGLDNGVFPRQDHHLGFDLMGSDYKPGDRSKKEADKSLFLDTLMAVREKLYLSYIGQSVKDNTEIPPSIVLDTLMDYLSLEAVKHPLHGFSNRYNNEELFTYLYNTQPDENVHKTKEQKTPSDSDLPEAPTEEIWVNDFVKFFEAPINWYFKKVLGINYDGEEDDTLPETELFELNKLQEWHIKNDLLKYKGNTDEEFTAFVQEHIKKGELPLKNLGRATLEKLLEDIEPVKERYLELTTGKEEKSVAIDLEVNGFRLTGTIDGVFGDQYVHVSVSTSTNKEKQLIRAYLKSLLLYASGSINDAKGLLLKKNSSTGAIQLDPIDFSYISIEDARKNLENLIEYLKKGKENPLKFSLKAAKSGTKKNPISVGSVYKALHDEAYPYNEDKIHPNLYLRKLIDENYFKNVEGNYQLNDDDVKEISTLAGLLNLYS